MNSFSFKVITLFQLVFAKSDSNGEGIPREKDRVLSKRSGQERKEFYRKTVVWTDEETDTHRHIAPALPNNRRSGKDEEIKKMKMANLRKFAK
jgi:hypothetical protein